jgi:hypothetical protein
MDDLVSILSRARSFYLRHGVRIGIGTHQTCCLLLRKGLPGFESQQVQGFYLGHGGRIGIRIHQACCFLLRTGRPGFDSQQGQEFLSSSRRPDWHWDSPSMLLVTSEWTTMVSMPSRARGFYLCHHLQTDTVTDLACCLLELGACFLQVKRSECEVNHRLPAC